MSFFWSKGLAQNIMSNVGGLGKQFRNDVQNAFLPQLAGMTMPAPELLQGNPLAKLGQQHFVGWQDMMRPLDASIMTAPVETTSTTIAPASNGRVAEWKCSQRWSTVGHDVVSQYEEVDLCSMMDCPTPMTEDMCNYVTSLLLHSHKDAEIGEYSARRFYPDGDECTLLWLDDMPTGSPTSLLYSQSICMTAAL